MSQVSAEQELRAAAHRIAVKAAAAQYVRFTKKADFDWGSIGKQLSSGWDTAKGYATSAGNQAMDFYNKADPSTQTGLLSALAGAGAGGLLGLGSHMMSDQPKKRPFTNMLTGALLGGGLGGGLGFGAHRTFFAQPGSPNVVPEKVQNLAARFPSVREKLLGKINEREQAANAKLTTGKKPLTTDEKLQSDLPKEYPGWGSDFVSAGQDFVSNPLPRLAPVGLLAGADVVGTQAARAMPGMGLGGAVAGRAFNNNVGELNKLDLRSVKGMLNAYRTNTNLKPRLLDMFAKVRAELVKEPIGIAGSRFGGSALGRIATYGATASAPLLWDAWKHRNNAEAAGMKAVEALPGAPK